MGLSLITCIEVEVGCAKVELAPYIGIATGTIPSMLSIEVTVRRVLSVGQVFDNQNSLVDDFVQMCLPLLVPKMNDVKLKRNLNRFLGRQ